MSSHATTFTPVVVVVPLRHRVSEAGKGQEPLSGVVISPGHNAAMSLPRVIAIDLDGTLLDNNSAVTDRSRRALTSATEAGVRVVIVTGRPPRDTDAIAALFDCAAVVCANGAHIRVPGQDTLIREFDRDNAEEILKVLPEALPSLGFGVDTGTEFFHDTVYAQHLPAWGSRRDVGGVLDDPKELLDVASPLLKIVARSSTHPVDHMLATAEGSIGQLADVTYSGGYGLVEISETGVNKGSTLELLCKDWGVTAEEVVAFGDMPNDLSSLTWAGTGYMMANGHPALADPGLGLLQAPANHEDGVAQVVEELLDRHRAA